MPIEIFNIIASYKELIPVIFLYMTLAFLWSVIRKRNDTADVAWGVGFILASWVSLLLNRSNSQRAILVVFLVTIWGIRLALHIFLRQRKKTEDSRYQQVRAKWGKWFFIRSYFQVFLLQGCFLLVVLSPVLFITSLPAKAFGVLDFLGLFVWTIGFCFEAVGDWQLGQFLSNPENKGKIMQQGLWQFTRHPNYFGEITQWWGIWLIALSLPYGWASFFGPATISFLILFVSGIPLLEKKYAGRKDFEEYRRRTSIFFPLPPKTSY